MDYPAPLVEIDDDGNLDLSDAYVQRIGAYDKLSVNWLYREFPPGTDEANALARIAQQGVEDGLIYMGHTKTTSSGQATSMPASGTTAPTSSTTSSSRSACARSDSNGSGRMRFGRASHCRIWSMCCSLFTCITAFSCARRPRASGVPTTGMQ